MSQGNVKKSLLDKFLGIFAEVHGGEGALSLLMTLNIFLILTGYYIAKVVREPLILAGGGAEVKAYSSALAGDRAGRRGKSLCVHGCAI